VTRTDCEVVQRWNEPHRVECALERVVPVVVEVERRQQRVHDPRQGRGERGSPHVRAGQTPQRLLREELRNKT